MLFFHYRAACPCLPSFPTRRSSDLVPSSHAERRRPAHAPLRRDLRGALHRSEEHTAELQSLRHLVCRLLLGKTNRSTPGPILGSGTAVFSSTWTSWPSFPPATRSVR